MNPILHLSVILSQFLSLEPKVKVVPISNFFRIDCMRKIQNEEADIVNLAANEAYIAAMNFSLTAIFQEERDNKKDGEKLENDLTSHL